VPPFQRRYVWTLNQASRFVESLLLGLPVPGVFLAKEEDTRKHLVIDGQQRIMTLKYFHDGVFEPNKRKFTLRKVQDHLEGLSYNDLSEFDRRRLDDSIIHATIVKQDEPSEDDSSIYHIFERLNTGGSLLTPQEIRACVFHGNFASLLQELNVDASWRSIFGKPSSRIRDQELILRFLALFFVRNTYQRPMKEFLNKFMGQNRTLDKYPEAAIRQAFLPTISLILASVGPKAFRPKSAVNAAVFDAVMVGLAQRLTTGPLPAERVKKAYDELVNDVDFRAATERSTADEEVVKARIELALGAFAGLQ
jgi:uncharacterized protein with ParB-like and HNH nuclease domain